MGGRLREILPPPFPLAPNRHRSINGGEKLVRELLDAVRVADVTKGRALDVVEQYRGIRAWMRSFSMVATLLMSSA